MIGKPSTLIELLHRNATYLSDCLAYVYLGDDGREEERVTYGQLDRQAQAIGILLQSLDAEGHRALLLYPPGLDYIRAFFGCLYAGVVAVPAYPPRPNRPAPRIRSIVDNAKAEFALTTTQILDSVGSRLQSIQELARLRWINTDEIHSGLGVEWKNPLVTADTLAFLQYTSGSTSAPKGVMLSHGNLMHNLELIRQGFKISSTSIGVFWLPSYHDMGLIGGILEPMYVGRPSILMSPLSFLQRPVRWLQTITRYQGTITGAPNFAYKLCADRITPEQCQELDLSSLSTAFCGAEPVRPETLEQFADSFQSCGFRREAFYPCYGLAEGTLLVSGGDGPAAPTYLSIQKQALKQNKATLSPPGTQDARTLVSCGHALLEQDIVIVEPDTLTRCEADQIGEIWLSGPSVAQGYWRQAEETELTFQAYLADTGEGPFLRTGDLGFIHNGELFITGRLKDMIIILGRNYYPEDIEQTVEKSHPALLAGRGAAFLVDEETAGSGRLVVVQEVERRCVRKLDKGEVTRAIRKAVAENYDLQVSTIVLAMPLSIPTTSSGKVQRYACRDKFLDGTLASIGE